MGAWTLEIELAEEAIFSQRPASLGGHGSLDRIPGSALLGAAAGRLYPRLDPALAWAAFHSGKLRFGDGLPVGPGDAPGWPAPLCWHHAKGESVAQGGRLDAGRVFNLMHCPDGKLPGQDADRQPKPLREDYITREGWLLRPETAFRMRTAINPETGRAAEAQLFGYTSLAAGQRFQAAIAWDEDLPAAVLEALRAFFAAGEMLLGRSRSAQFGRALCRLREQAPALPKEAAGAAGCVSLWLLSDLAAVDAHGMPTLAPSAADLGLPRGEALAAQTYARFRSYSPYNAHHKLYGRERQVIAAGSVLSFALATAAELAEWRRIAAAGLGLYREAGLGQVVVQAEWLGGVQPSFDPPAPPPQAGEASPAMPDHPFARWLQRSADSREADEDRKRWAQAILLQLDELECNARALAGLDLSQPAGPGKSQWGRVAELAKAAAQGRGRLAELFDPENGVCKASDPDWGRASQLGGQSTTFADWLRGLTAQRPDDAAPCLALLANLAHKRLNR